MADLWGEGVTLAAGHGEGRGGGVGIIVVVVVVVNLPLGCAEFACERG